MSFELESVTGGEQIDGLDAFAHEHCKTHLGHVVLSPLTIGVPADRLVALESDLTARNAEFAAMNRSDFAERQVFAANLMSAPGAGKTTLLCRTAELLNGIDMAVVEGDPQTQRDAERVRAAGAPAVQINTGTTCRLDGYMVHRAVSDMELRRKSLMFIENLGNLIGPGNVDLGEDIKVAVTAVTEGECKPLKYPEIFAHARLAILTKIDLAPHCDVDLELLEHNLRKVSPQIAIIRLSAQTGEGMEAWLAWLRAKLELKALASRA